jgi:hypothetical protein
MMKQREIYKTIKEMDPELSKEDEAFKIAAVLLASTQVGTNAVKCAKLLRKPINEVAPIAKQIRDAGVWKGHRISASGWTDPETGGIGFWMDVLCCQGLMERVPA